MAAIAQILDVERDNTDRIHLFREGLFLKAYQHSALLFIKNVKNFKSVKQYYKAVDAEVVMLGFPSNQLDTLIGSGVQQLDPWHFVVQCDEPLDPNEYRVWFDSIPLAPKKERTARHESPPMPRMDDIFTVSEIHVPVTDPLGDAGRSVIRQLESFSLENATPLECMMFLSKLKAELKRRTDGGV
ncbi:hypothetical protein [uncultured Alistipes sp.]|jgi:hypothetical protein|uniref:hypothetical protein n=1 Tax=uncultured Alistipes sp. TaxID=538949 RepID=UPI0025EB1921|nr:hypothetical protein [uncultured Alistipes sp.]